MNLERILIIVIVAAAILAAIPAIPVAAEIWGVILVVAGLIVGFAGLQGADTAQRVAVYVIAFILPVISDSLDVIWVIGPWVDFVLDNVALGLQGMALGLFVMAVWGRVAGTATP